MAHLIYLIILNQDYFFMHFDILNLSIAIIAIALRTHFLITFKIFKMLISYVTLAFYSRNSIATKDGPDFSILWSYFKEINRLIHLRPHSIEIEIRVTENH